MRTRIFLAILVFLLPICSASAGGHLVPDELFSLVVGELSGEAARENTQRIVEYHRIQGSPMMATVAERVVLPALKAAGLDARIEQFASDGATRYQTFWSPMGWDMRGGELWVQRASSSSFVPFRLCRYSDVPMCVSTYSKGGTWSGELVDVGPGLSDRDYEGRDVRGKVALASGYAANVVRQAVIARGAVGVVIYPSALDRPDHPEMVRYNGIWPLASELDRTSGGFQISATQYSQLKALMWNGPVEVRGTIDATLAPGQLTVVHAFIPGSDASREILVTAHLDHPKWSANDNASGSGLMMEAARTLQALVSSGKVSKPRTGIHFMWVPEYMGTIAYFTRHPEARGCGPWDDPRTPGIAPAPCIVANLNLDMVGEDTVKTNSRFYMTRSPDSVSGFLDGLLEDLLDQTRVAGIVAPNGTRNLWPAEMIPYAQGSDHDVLLGLGVPSSMLGHDPDWTHHTSEDTIDKTDASEFRRVGVITGAAALWMAGASDADWVRARSLGASTRAAEYARRLGGRMAIASSSDARARLSRNQAATDSLQRALSESGLTPASSPAASASASAGTGPRRLVLLPLDASAWQGVSADDQRWMDEQSQKFDGGGGGGLATAPTLDLIVFETINFMNGLLSTSAIADRLSFEYGVDIDGAWVDRLVAILVSQKLVARK
jgi:hypothetical protein